MNSPVTIVVSATLVLTLLSRFVPSLLLALAIFAPITVAHSQAGDAKVAAEPVLSNSLRPQADFYSYVNAKWLAETVIPDDVPC